MGERNSVNCEYFNPWHPLQPYYIEALEIKSAIENGLKYDKKREEFLKEIFRPLDYTLFNDLILFKYKSYIELNEMGYGANFFELHDGLYRSCRSIVLNRYTGRVVLASLDKFKNFDEEEQGDWSRESCWKKFLNADKTYITNKMDGSYQQYTWDAVNKCVIGSGSSGLDPELSWRLKKGLKIINEEFIFASLQAYPNWTFIFEFISPDNPIVVKYTKGEEGLYLLAMRNNNTGEEKSFEELKVIACAWGLRITDWYENMGLDETLSYTDKFLSSEKEGWVVDCVKGVEHFRFKVKTVDYVIMHRALSNLISPNAVAEAVYWNRFDDFLSKSPDAYKEKLIEIANNIIQYNQLYKKLAWNYYSQMKAACGTGERTRETMIWINENVPTSIREATRAIVLGTVELSPLTQGKGDMLKSYSKMMDHYSELKKLI